ncbi:MAG: hypothetical protein HQL25_01220 [Candidatus Omnitrophica bacterium]|nr:hypothetical protein [Candidatus Omnitrophota bacterium]
MGKILTIKVCSVMIVILNTQIIFYENANAQFAVIDAVNAELQGQTNVELGKIFFEETAINTKLNELLKSVKPAGNIAYHDATEELKILNEQAHQGKAISYSMLQLDKKFKERFPGYKPSEDFQSEYEKWTEATMDSFYASLDAAKTQKEEFSVEKDYLRKWKDRSDSAVGQTQALQVSNRIQLELATQIQKLRQLMMLQIQSQNAYMASQMQKDAAIEASTKQSVYLLKNEQNHAGY